MKNKKKLNKLIIFSILFLVVGIFFIGFLSQSFFGWTTLTGYTNPFHINPGISGANSTEAYLVLPKLTNNFSFNVKYHLQSDNGDDMSGNADIVVIYEIFNYKTNQYETIENKEWYLQPCTSSNRCTSQTSLYTSGTNIYQTNIPQHLTSIRYGKYVYKQSFSCLNNQTAEYAQSVNPYSVGSSSYSYYCIYPDKFVIDKSAYDSSIQRYNIKYFPQLLTFGKDYIKEDKAKFRISVNSKNSNSGNIHQNDFDVDLWNIVSGKLNYYEYDSTTNKCNLVQLEEYRKNVTIDFDNLTACNNAYNLISSAPTSPTPTGFTLWISLIVDWFKNLFSGSLFLSQTMLGNTTIQPNSIQTYTINLTAPTPDNDWSDGNYQVQYANWALIDSNGNIKLQGNWEKINGIYNKQITITTPSNIGNYVLLGVITQYNMTYDYSLGIWNHAEEQLINKEAINLKSKYSIISPTNPSASGWNNFLSSIINWFKNLFGIK